MFVTVNYCQPTSKQVLIGQCSACTSALSLGLKFVLCVCVCVSFQSTFIAIQCPIFGFLLPDFTELILVIVPIGASKGTIDQCLE